MEAKEKGKVGKSKGAYFYFGLNVFFYLFFKKKFGLLIF
jgi:hypothetical protein